MNELWADRPGLRWLFVTAMAVGLLIAVASLVRRVPSGQARYFTDREAAAGHVVMLAAMIVMVVDTKHDVPVTWWRILFGLLAAAYLAAIALQIRDLERAASAGYHLTCALAMLYATLAHHPAIQETPGPHHHHALVVGLPWPWLGTVLTGLFLIDACATAWVAGTGRLPGDATRLPTGCRVQVLPHIVMDLAMAVMLVVAG